jgi:hypothetical protein
MVKQSKCYSRPLWELALCIFHINFDTKRITLQWGSHFFQISDLCDCEFYSITHFWADTKPTCTNYKEPFNSCAALLKIWCSYEKFYETLLCSKILMFWFLYLWNKFRIKFYWESDVSMLSIIGRLPVEIISVWPNKNRKDRAQTIQVWYQS